MLKRVEKNYMTSYSSSVSEVNTVCSFKSLSSDPSATGATCEFSCSQKNDLSLYASLSITFNTSQTALYALTIFSRIVDTNSLAAASSVPKSTPT